MRIAFFGHKDTPMEIREKLRVQLTDLIENYGADQFYLGHQGNFDRMVLDVLKGLQIIYPHIRFTLVLAYLPGEKQKDIFFDAIPTLYPEGLEKIPKKYAISHRNRYMVENCDAFVTYVCRSFGGAAKFEALAEKRGKPIFKLSKSL